LSSSYASIANRVSYFFNWHGPSMAVDTMCSSSLTAIHLACASLLRGETELALAGGVNVTVHPHKDMLLAPGGFAASDGRCRSFGEGGDGYVPGEGVGAVLLKPLARARADGDHIWGVIKATAVNHGGKTNGYTVPNPKAQAEVVGTALARSGVAPGEVSYIEAHGTGTALGDPIEISALARAFGAERAVCAVGSVKSNIGHLESAAGVAGLTKVLLQMRHGQIAPSLHSARLNPNIRFGESGFRVPQALEAWSRKAAPRVAGVSSFGAGGANAHVVVEEFAGAAAQAAAHAASTGDCLVVLSAKTEDRLIARARQLAAWLETQGEAVALADVAWTLQTGREALEERLALRVASLDELARRLMLFVSGGAAGSTGSEVWRGRARSEGGPVALSAPQGASAEALAQHWVQGGEVSWAEQWQGRQPLRVSLPVYPFFGERYWAPDKIAAEKPRLNVVMSESVTAPRVEAEAIFLRPAWHAAERSVGAMKEPCARILLIGAEAGAAQALRAAYPKTEFEIASWRDDFGRWAQSSALPAHTLWCAPAGVDLETALEAGLHGLVRWAQAALAQGARGPVKLVFCHPPGVPAYAAVTGWARALGQEQPNLQVTVLETERVGPEVVAEFLETVESREVRLAGAQRWVRALEPLSLDERATPRGRSGGVKPRGVYLITGGMGGIGKKLALSLAKNAGARLVLTGRSASGAEQERVLSAIRAAGGEGIYVQADISARDGAFAAAAAARRAFGRIDGVIHSAGVLRDGFVLKKSAGDYAAVLAPKVHGATWLDEATTGDTLDFFALFSSTAGIFGSVGQADYAFANAFLDAFAELRAQRVAAGQRAGRTVSIGWPLWSDGGMPVGREVLSRLAQAGLAPLPDEVGLRWFDLLVAAGETRVTPLWGEREKVLALFTRKPAARPVAQTESVATSANVPGDLIERVEVYVRETLGAVIQMEADKVDLDVRFDEIGVDSIVVNDVNLRFERDLGAVPKTLLFEHPNVRRLARHLAETQAEAFGRLWGTGDKQAVAQGRQAETPPAISRHEAAPPQPAVSDIAVIGLAGRFPGAPDVHRFWDVLREGRDEVTEIPRERWDIDAHFDANPEKAVEGKMYGRWGAFLRDVDKFDPLFFNLSPVEAEMMDPQERLFLEVAWHTLEDAGYTRRELRRWAAREFAANVGVFVGVTSNSYSLLGHAAGGPVAAPTSLPWSLANRISYLFNFNGPSMPVDTACSSSLTAVHLAVEAIRRGECQQAIAGGVNLYLHPSKYSHLSLMKMLSTDGKCRAFGDGGDGFVPGEGAGAVLLKPLAKALADGDRIWGVIKGTAVNHGGRTNGYTVPSPVAQAELVARALESARVDPATISYIEAHGTGTALGDPIEVEGLSRALARESAATPCAVGSAKANIGHLESASGIAGLAKVLLQMRHRQIAPSLHANPPNPRIDFSRTPLRVQTTLGAWTRPVVHGRPMPRRAGVSSFGAGGSNAHVVIEEAPEIAERATAGEALIVLSAKNRERLRATAAGLLDYLQRETTAPRALAGIAWTLQSGREAMEERVAYLARSFTELLEGLREIASEAGVSSAGVVWRGKVKRERVLASVEEGAASERLAAGEWKIAAEKWVAGAEIDWRALHGGADLRRVSLPGYAFARERYWIPEVPGIAVPAVAAHSPKLPAESVVRIAQTERVLADHVVRGTPVLPGAATLELARAAAARALGSGRVELRNVVWQRPLTADDSGVDAVLRLRGESAGLAFEIGDARGEVFVQGRAGVRAGGGGESDPVDIGAVRERCAREIATGDLYAGFAERGIRYGEAFRVVRALRCGAGEALAELAVPEVWGATGGELHPALVDGALQALGAIGAGEGGLEIPFAVAEVRSFAACPRTVFAHVRRAAESAAGRRYDLRLVAEDGRVVAELIGLSVRRYAGDAPAAKVEFGQVNWSEQPLATAPTWAGVVLVVGGDARWAASAPAGARVVGADIDADAERVLREAQPVAVVVCGRAGALAESGVVALHRWAQACIRVMGTKPVPMTFAYPDAAPELAGACGYVRSLRLEHPGWTLVTVAMRENVSLSQVLAEMSGTGADVRLSGAGGRAVRAIEPAALGERAAGLRRGGVYFITGGLGGLGRIFAEFLLERWDARVVLAGRAEPDAAKRAWLGRWGERVSYLRDDVTRPG
ncbi:MAG TPA: SDR family NAD(P)-dependent oxidoreductase, partial [Opitutaceae bacterium]